jgi:hypothetical protein
MTGCRLNPCALNAPPVPKYLLFTFQGSPDECHVLSITSEGSSSLEVRASGDGAAGDLEARVRVTVHMRGTHRGPDPGLR